MGFISSLINFFHDLFFGKETNSNVETVIVDDKTDNNLSVDETEPVETINNTNVTSSNEPDNRLTGYDFSKFHVLIDNGHGKNTSGKGSPYSLAGVEPKLPYREYEWAREIAKMIESELNKLGFNAERIVPEENDITLTERVRRANSRTTSYGVQNTILISIHSNAAGSGSKWMTGRGWSAYTSKGQTNGDKLCEYIYKEAEKNFKGMKIRKDTSDGDSDMEENFTMLKKTSCPAVLSENFFHDNIQDVEFITSDEGKAAVVKTHVDGIVEYFKTKK